MIFISTEGHGYLRISHAQLKASGFVPTAYSFINDNAVLLEEDCDAPGFLKAEKEQGREYPYIKSKHQKDINRNLYGRINENTLQYYGIRKIEV